MEVSKNHISEQQRKINLNFNGESGPETPPLWIYAFGFMIIGIWYKYVQCILYNLTITYKVGIIIIIN